MERDTQVKSLGKAPDESTPLKRLTEASNQDEVTYYDPMGYTAPQPVDLRAEMYEKGNWEEKFEKVDDLRAKGVKLEKAIEKSVDTGTYSLPVWVTDDVIVSDGQDSPIANTVARVAVDSNELRVDEITAVGQAGSFTEGGTVPENDDTVSKYTYNVQMYGRKNTVEELAQISASRYSPTQRAQQLQAESIRRYEEAQAIQGTNNDADSFEGLADFVDSSRSFDGTGTQAGLSEVRDLITELETLGTNVGDIMVVTDHRTFRNLKDGLDSVLRFESPGEQIDYGVQALSVDGARVMKSHGTPSSSGSREVYAFDASAHWYGMLRDISITALPRSDTGEKFKTDAYGVFVSQAKQRIARYTNLD